MPTTPKPLRLLESLNLFGLTHLDPVILAALADERPLLLIAPHGTAKSELLNRLASSLGLEHRHYNASLIAFDDLLGFPVPNKNRTGLDYLPTPGNLWEAESVFLDEISRCRPENQNKLFSVIHERRIQGLALPKLRYRWSAMNPPLTGEEADNEEVYEGSLPLDPALADRFSYVVTLPSFRDLPSTVRRSIIQSGGEPPRGQQQLATLITQARRHIEAGRETWQGWTAAYVDALVEPLEEAGLGISGRRAVSMASSISSIAGAFRALKLDLRLEDAALFALKWGLPQRCQGRRIDEAKLRAIHALALKQAGDIQGGIWSQHRCLKDPVKRIALALEHAEEIGKLELSNLVSDSFASMSVPRRYLLAQVLVPELMRRAYVNTPTLELLTGLLEKVRAFAEGNSHQVTTPITQANALSRRIAQITKVGAKDPALGNLLMYLVAVQQESFDVEELVELSQEWRATLLGNETRGVA